MKVFETDQSTFIAGFCTLLLSVAILTSALFLMTIPHAQALSCIASGSAEEELELHDVVLYGTVVDVQLDEGDLGVGGDEAGSIEIDVEEWFKGGIENSVTLELGSYSTWYGIPVEGEAAVLYVQELNGQEMLTMPLCGRSVIGAGAEAELAALRGEFVEEEPPTLEEILGEEEEELFNTEEDSRVATACHTVEFEAPPYVPGAGLAYESLTGELLLGAFCPDGGMVELEVGDEDAIVYQSGFIRVDNTWRAIRFEGTALQKGWLQGVAEYSVPSEMVSEGESFQYLALVCTPDEGSWRCGCKDGLCDQPSWQMQNVDVPISILTE